MRRMSRDSLDFVVCTNITSVCRLIAHNTHTTHTLNTHTHTHTQSTYKNVYVPLSSVVTLATHQSDIQLWCMLLPQSCTALTTAGYVLRDTGGSEKDVLQYGNSLHIAGCDDPIEN